MRILVVRFRQMGDALLATPLLSTLRLNFPDAEIDFVLNARLAPLFEGHPAISRIITFTDEERHRARTYIRKVWHTVHHTRYDVIIDMRSTTNTMLFALFSRASRWRIGIRKPYTRGVFNRRYEACSADESMTAHNLRLAEPLREALPTGAAWRTDSNLSLAITPLEQADFRSYMQRQGIDFGRPVLLVGVTAKLADKTWAEDRMTETLRRLVCARPDMQLVFNFAPGREADNAHRIYDALCAALGQQAQNVFLNIEARSPRQLAAMAANCTAYFGNEGGARHIVHAMRRPSMVVCSPGASKTTWLPQGGDVPAWGIAAADVADVTGLSPQQQYDLLTVDRVWTMLSDFLAVGELKGS